MGRETFHKIPAKCPVTGERLYVSELTSAETGVTIRGKFEVPTTAGLDSDQAHLLEVFLRARGVISTMEKELNLSYPTVRSRVDALLVSLGLEPYKPDRRDEAKADEKRRILQELEDGKITAAEAKEKIKRNGSR